MNSSTRTATPDKSSTDERQPPIPQTVNESNHIERLQAVHHGTYPETGLGLATPVLKPPLRSFTSDSGYISEELNLARSRAISRQNGDSRHPYRELRPMPRSYWIKEPGTISHGLKFTTQNAMSILSPLPKFFRKQPNSVDMIQKMQTNHERQYLPSGTLNLECSPRLSTGIGAQFDYPRDMTLGGSLGDAARIHSTAALQYPFPITTCDGAPPQRFYAVTPPVTMHLQQRPAICSLTSNQDHYTITENVQNEGYGQCHTEESQDTGFHRVHSSVPVRDDGDNSDDANPYPKWAQVLQQFLASTTRSFKQLSISDTTSSQTTTTNPGTNSSRQSRPTSWFSNNTTSTTGTSGGASSGINQGGGGHNHHEDEYDDSENQDGSNLGGRLGKRSRCIKDHNLACPFHKWNFRQFCGLVDSQYNTCCNAFRDTALLKQHFNEVHYNGRKHCPRCFKKIPDEAVLMDHLRQPNMCSMKPDHEIESQLWLTPNSERTKRLQKLGKKAPTRSTATTRAMAHHWEQIWKALFPTDPCPSPYRDGNCSGQAYRIDDQRVNSTLLAPVAAPHHFVQDSPLLDTLRRPSLGARIICQNHNEHGNHRLSHIEIPAGEVPPGLDSALAPLIHQHTEYESAGQANAVASTTQSHLAPQPYQALLNGNYLPLNTSRGQTLDQSSQGNVHLSHAYANQRPILDVPLLRVELEQNSIPNDQYQLRRDLDRSFLPPASPQVNIPITPHVLSVHPPNQSMHAYTHLNVPTNTPHSVSYRATSPIYQGPMSVNGATAPVINNNSPRFCPYPFTTSNGATVHGLNGRRIDDSTHTRIPGGGAIAEIAEGTFLDESVPDFQLSYGNYFQKP